MSTRTLPAGVWDTERIGGAEPGAHRPAGARRRHRARGARSRHRQHRAVGARRRRPALAARRCRTAALRTSCAGRCSRGRAPRCSTGGSRRISAATRRSAPRSWIVSTERALRLAVTQAISQLNRVDRRLLALFWHLAERWGRMTVRRRRAADDALAPHARVSSSALAGRPSRPPSASSAKQGVLARRSDGTWLLTGEPIGLPRRRERPGDPDPAPPAAGRRGDRAGGRCRRRGPRHRPRRAAADAATGSRAVRDQ